MDDPQESEAEKNRTRNSELLPLVYNELRKLAQYKMKNEGGPQTLSATALVHEAYIRLSNEEEISRHWENKRHYFSAAAEAMRRILIDRARAKQAAKRGGNFVRGDFFESQIEAPIKEDKILAVDEALGELETVDPELAKLVKLRYFAGMSWPEISQATGIPDRTLRRRWTYAKAWLKERIERSA